MSQTALAEPAPHAPSTPRFQMLIPLIVACGGFMTTLDSTIITTALPQIAGTLHVAPIRVSVAITSYLISLAIVTPASGWLADRFGTRTLYCWAIVLFTGGSALCGITSTLHTLVLMRIVQGCGGGLLTPVGRLILVRSFGKDDLLRAMSYMIVPAVIGPTIGPLAGGYLATYVTWRWIFYINIPIGLAGIVLTLRYVHNDRGPRRDGFDWLGFLLVGAGLALLEFAIERLGRGLIPVWAQVGLFVASGVLLSVYLLYSRRLSRSGKKRPILNLQLFRIHTFRLALILSAVVRATGGAVPFLVPLMLQLGFGFSPMRSGWLTFTSSLGAIFIRPLTSPLLKRLGFRGLLAGNAVLLAGCTAGLAFFRPATPQWFILVYLLIFGLFRSMIFILSVTLAYADIGQAIMSQATPPERMVQQLATGLGIALAAAALAILAGHTGGTVTTAAFRPVLWATAGVSLLALWPIACLHRNEAAAIAGKHDTAD